MWTETLPEMVCLSLSVLVPPQVLLTRYDNPLDSCSSNLIYDIAFLLPSCVLMLLFEIPSQCSAI